MKVSERGIDLIASFEGYSASCYNDPAGNATVGYGQLLHLGPCTSSDMTLTQNEDEARQWLRDTAQSYGDQIAPLTRELTQSEYDALVDLAYNIGVSGYARSAVRAAVNAGGDVCAALRLYVYGSDGVSYPGLRRRRELECELFMEGGLMTAEYDALKETDDAIKAQLLATAIDLGKKVDGLKEAIGAVAFANAGSFAAIESRLTALEAK